MIIKHLYKHLYLTVLFFSTLSTAHATVVRMDFAIGDQSTGQVYVELFDADAPNTVANFLKLARSGYYDGILFHRVVPGFVAQAGCPRGDGWGGPGHTIPCEVTDRTYRRGSLGMALAGLSIGNGRDAYGTGVGQLLVAVALLTIIGCWIWAGHIMRLPSEERVFS